jgi:hypothetical protein
MSKAMKILLQVAMFSAFAVVIVTFSIFPKYHYASQDSAVIKLSLSHAAERINPCETRTVEEIAAMPAYERRPIKCERERLPLNVELEIDGAIVVSIEEPPSGFWSDGAASIYEKIELQPGVHHVTARLRDKGGDSGWDYSHSGVVELEAGRYFTVTFKAETGGFVFR